MMDDPVRRALAELADADAVRHAPAHLERAILDAFDRHREPGWFQRYAATVRVYRREAVAAAVAIGVATTLYFNVLDRAGPPSVPPVPEPAEAQERRMSDEAMHSVHVRVPRSYLPLLGVPIIDPDADGMITLEVGVAEDGLVRTIHVVR